MLNHAADHMPSSIPPSFPAQRRLARNHMEIYHIRIFIGRERMLEARRLPYS
jgi:hypothetical protein